MIPTKQICEQLWCKMRLPEDLKVHQAAVADMAVKIGLALNQRGYSFNLPLIEAAALLHDIGKGKPHHAAAGAKMLMKLGYAEISPLVAAHMRLPEKNIPELSEQTLVFLADKLVQGTEPASVEERYAAKLAFFSGNQQALETIREQQKIALQIEELLNQALRNTDMETQTCSEGERNEAD
jgi:molybdenum cofactor cytidylyltransferase